MENKSPLGPEPLGAKSRSSALVIAHQHPWNVAPKRATAIQEELRQHWIGEDRFGKIRTVVGLDAAFVLTGSQAIQKRTWRRNAPGEANRAIGCVVLYRYPQLQEIERASAVLPLRFPYLPGFLSFREIPVLLAALGKLHTQPDLLFCDGQGYAHPRRMGLATHLGIILDRPSIGCAKSLLIGTPGSLEEKAGSWSALLDPKTGERIGAMLRTRDQVNPIYVSQGHRVSLASAIRLTLRVTDGLRIPRPTRDADQFAAETKRKLLAGQLSEK